MPAQTPKTPTSSKEENVKKREVKPPAIQDALAPEGAPPMTDLQRAVADPRTACPPEILALQRKYGNEAVQQLLVNHNLHAKLTVGAANDSCEQEADRVAAEVMSAPVANAPVVQRHGEEEELQTKSIAEDGSFAPGADFEDRLAATRGDGRPLPKTTRDFMESRFGVDFSGVRLHTGEESARLNREIGAQAFTRGEDIYLSDGKDNTESKAGQQLLAHELTHVVQQTGTALQRMRLPHRLPTEKPLAKPGNLAIHTKRAITPLSANASRPIIQRHFPGSLQELGSSIVSVIAAIPTYLAWAYQSLFGSTSASSNPSAPVSAPASSAAVSVPVSAPTPSEAVSAPASSASVSVPVIAPTPPAPVSAPASSAAVSVPVSAPIPPAPVTQESVRSAVSTFDPTRGDIIAYIKARITDLQTIRGLISVVPRADLVAALARDMAARAGAGAVGPDHAAAAEREVSNGGGGFTALDGHIYVLDTAENSSALFHEVIHVLSGPGGDTPISRIKMNLNEGFTNYFAEEVARSTGGTVYPAYPFATAWVRSFVATHGREVAYNIYFHGDLDLLYNTMANFYLGKARGGVGGAIKLADVNACKFRGEFSLDAALKQVKNKIKLANFVEVDDPINAWFAGRVF